MGSRFEIRGDCEPGFAAVREAFVRNFDRGLEVGASFCAFVDGRPIVDLWGGHADAARTRIWERDTLVNVYSTTKTMAALTVLMLVDRGDVDLDARVTDLWPEFGGAGKEQVRVRHLLSHTAGLPGWDESITAAQLCQWDYAVGLLAAQAPWWKPGERSGYHAFTQGFLLGEIVRRVTGRSLGTFFREEVAEPLGADFHIGLPEGHEARVGEMIPPQGASLGSDLAIEPGSITDRVLRNPVMTGDVANTRTWRAAEIPAANGQGNARSVARIAGALAKRGNLEGVHLLGTETLDRMVEEQCYAHDSVLGLRVRWGLGVALASEELPIGRNRRTCFWGGWGGSLVVIDLDARLGFAYVMNRMSATTLGDARAFGPAKALFEAVRS